MRPFRRRAAHASVVLLVVLLGAACDDDATTTGTGGDTSASTTGSPTTTTTTTTTTSSSMDLCANVDCPPPGACQAAVACNPATGLCDATLKDNGTACDDGVACTENDVCGGGVCAGTTITCPALASCVAGTCLAPACTGNLGLPGPQRFAGGDVGAVLDFNGDGIPDAVSVSGSDVVVFAGEGGGFFHYDQSFSFPGQSANARAADFDANGKPDVVVGNVVASAFHVVRDDGSVVDVGGLVGPPSVVVPADVASSPALDVVYFTPAGDVGVMVNAGGLTFNPGAIGVVGAPPHDAVAADFNGDGKTDVVVATDDGLRVLFGNGVGTFPSTAVVGAGTAFTSVAALDLDGDGKPDLAATTGAAPVIIQNTGAAFVVVNTIPMMPVDAVRAADMDGDGKLDLVLRGTCTDVGCGPGLNGSVHVLLNTGSFGFSYLGITERVAGPGGLVVADLDGDMNPDVLVSGGQSVDPLLQDSAGVGFLPGAPALAFPGTAAIGTGDFDADGTVDFVLSRHPIGPGAYNTVEVFESNGVGVVPGPVSLGTDSSLPAPVGVASADVDHDGHVDVVLLDPGPALHWMRNTTATGTFGDLKTVALPAAPGAFDVSDLDGDGDVDVAVVFPSLTTVTVVRDLGGADASTTINIGLALTAIASGDVDGDGDRDLVVGGDGGFAVLRNDGAAWMVSGYGTYTPTAVVVRDVDADGHVDVVLADATHVDAFFGDGVGGFAPGNGIPGVGGGATSSTNLVVLDADTDGLPDVLAVSADRNDATLFRHVGARAFFATTYGVSSKPFAAVSVDVDLDARPDVVVLAEKFVNVLPARCAP